MQYLKEFYTQSAGVGFFAKTPFIGTVRDISGKVLYVPQNIGDEVEIFDDGNGFLTYEHAPEPIDEIIDLDYIKIGYCASIDTGVKANINQRYVGCVSQDYMDTDGSVANAVRNNEYINSHYLGVRSLSLQKDKAMSLYIQKYNQFVFDIRMNGRTNNVFVCQLGRGSNYNNDVVNDEISFDIDLMNKAYHISSKYGNSSGSISSAYGLVTDNTIWLGDYSYSNQEDLINNTLLNSPISNTKIKNFSIYEDGNQIKDFKPVLFNGVPCLYDTINKTPHYVNVDNGGVIRYSLNNEEQLYYKNITIW